MLLKIDNAQVMFRAIESFSYADGSLVVRTVSGQEYRRPVKDQATFDAIVDSITTSMAINEVVS